MDTRNKRAAAINVGSPWRGMLPAPDGSVDEADRVQLLFLYAGIQPDEPPPRLPGDASYAVLLRRRR